MTAAEYLFLENLTKERNKYNSTRKLIGSKENVNGKSQKVKFFSRKTNCERTAVNKEPNSMLVCNRRELFQHNKTKDNSDKKTRFINTDVICYGKKLKAKDHHLQNDIKEYEKYISSIKSSALNVQKNVDYVFCTQSVTENESGVLRLPLSVGTLMEMRIANALRADVDDDDDVFIVENTQEVGVANRKCRYNTLHHNVCHVIEPEMDYTDGIDASENMQEKLNDIDGDHSNLVVSQSEMEDENSLGDISQAVAVNLVEDNGNSQDKNESFIHENNNAVTPVLIQPICDNEQTYNDKESSQLISKTTENTNIKESELVEKDYSQSNITYFQKYHTSVTEDSNNEIYRYNLTSGIEQQGYNGLHVHDCEINYELSDSFENFHNPNHIFANCGGANLTQRDTKSVNNNDGKEHSLGSSEHLNAAEIDYNRKSQQYIESKSPILHSYLRPQKGCSVETPYDLTCDTRDDIKEHCLANSNGENIDDNYHGVGIVEEDAKVTLCELLKKSNNKNWQSNFQEYVNSSKTTEHVNAKVKEHNVEKQKILGEILTQVQFTENKRTDEVKYCKPKQPVLPKVNLNINQDKNNPLKRDAKEHKDSDIKAVLPKINISVVSYKLSQDAYHNHNSRTKSIDEDIKDTKTSKDCLINHSDCLNENKISTDQNLNESCNYMKGYIATNDHKLESDDVLKNRTVVESVLPAVTSLKVMNQNQAAELDGKKPDSSINRNDRHDNFLQQDYRFRLACNKMDNSNSPAKENVTVKYQDKEIISDIKSDKSDKDTGNSILNTTFIPEPRLLPPLSLEKEFVDLSSFSCANVDDTSEYDAELSQLQKEYEKFEQIYQRLTIFEERKNKEREILLQRKRKATEILCRIRKKIGSFENTIADIDRELASCSENSNLDEGMNGHHHNGLDNTNFKHDQIQKCLKLQQYKNVALDLSNNHETPLKVNNEESTISSTVCEEDISVHKQPLVESSKINTSVSISVPSHENIFPSNRKNSPDCIMVSDHGLNKNTNKNKNEFITKKSNNLQSLEVMCNTKITDCKQDKPKKMNNKQSLNNNYGPRPVMFGEYPLHPHPMMPGNNMSNNNHMMAQSQTIRFQHQIQPNIQVHPAFPIRYIDNTRFQKNQMIVPNFMQGNPTSVVPSRHIYAPPNCYTGPAQNGGKRNPLDEYFAPYGYVQRDTPNQMLNPNQQVKQTMIDQNSCTQYARPVHPSYQYSPTPPKLVTQEEYFNINYNNKCLERQAMHRHPLQEGNKQIQQVMHLNGRNPENYDVCNLMNCSMCGVKAIFICAGCKQAPYCSDNCQRRNWNEHKESCRRSK